VNRRGAVRAALLLVAAALVAAGPSSIGTAAGTEPEPPLPEVPVTVNDLIGESETFFEDCVGTSLQRPGCGSKGRGGWRQAAVFAAVVAGVGVVALRIVVGARRNRAAKPPAGAPPAGSG